MAMVESRAADFAVFLTWKLTSKGGFAELSLCIREETSPGGGGGGEYLQESWLGLCCWNLLILTLVKVLSNQLLNTFFKIEDTM